MSIRMDVFHREVGNQTDQERTNQLKKKQETVDAYSFSIYGHRCDQVLDSSMY